MAQPNANNRPFMDRGTAHASSLPAMPRWWLLLLFWPALSSGQWQFNVLNNDIEQRSSELQFPIEYKHFDCRFRFQAINNGITDNIQIINGAGCDANNHKLVIDGWQYTLPESFEMNLFSDQWLITGVVPLGNCTTDSGSPINTAPPRLQLNGLLIQISDTYYPDIFVKDDITYFVFGSTNGDISCTLGEPFTNPLNLIFKWGFQ